MFSETTRPLCTLLCLSLALCLQDWRSGKRSRVLRSKRLLVVVSALLRLGQSEAVKAPMLRQSTSCLTCFLRLQVQVVLLCYAIACSMYVYMLSCCEMCSCDLLYVYAFKRHVPRENVLLILVG